MPETSERSELARRLYRFPAQFALARRDPGARQFVHRRTAAAAQLEASSTAGAARPGDITGIRPFARLKKDKASPDGRLPSQ